MSDRVVMVKLQTKPFNINMIHVCASTQDYDDETIEGFYTKSSDIICIMGDLNAKVGNVKDSKIIGDFGLAKQNERGQRLIEFCNENNMVIMNTWFQQPLPRLYTWKSQGDISRHHIDYIMINQRFKNCIKQARIYPGADINSSHNPVTLKFKVKLKVIKRNQAQSQIDYNLLKDGIYKGRYNILVKNYDDVLVSEEVEQDHESEEEHVAKEWNKGKLSLQNAAKEHTSKKVKKKKRGWMNDEILSKMEQRKNVKNKTTEYNVTNKEIVDECSQAKENWLNEQCEEIDSLEKQHKTK